MIRVQSDWRMRHQIDDEYLWVFDSRSLWFDGRYVVFADDRRKVYLHRWLMAEPNGIVDHINGDKLDNRKSNLRVTDKRINSVNSKLRTDNTSGVRGVDCLRGRWRASICVGGRNHHIGMFPTRAEATDARRAAERHYFGEECP